MGAHSEIAWTDATVNFWWGCTKVGPGCEFCYAEAFDHRLGGAHWGRGAPRRKIKGAVALIHRLDNNYADWAADRECTVGNAKAFGLPVPMIGLRRRVFIQSMSDLFDLEVEIEWFAEAWQHIEACDRIDIQIVTKRISAVEKRLAAIGRTTWPRHAGLMITVVNQEEADRDLPRLLALKAKLGIPWVGLSVEPMLGPIDLERAPYGNGIHGVSWLTGKPFLIEGAYSGHPTPPDRERLDWIICGGESGPRARDFHLSWAKSLIEQCRGAKVPAFMKQVGSNAWDDISYVGSMPAFKTRDRKGGTMDEWPAVLQVREMPA